MAQAAIEVPVAAVPLVAASVQQLLEDKGATGASACAETLAILTAGCMVETLAEGQLCCRSLQQAAATTSSTRCLQADSAGMLADLTPSATAAGPHHGELLVFGMVRQGRRWRVQGRKQPAADGCERHPGPGAGCLPAECRQDNSRCAARTQPNTPRKACQPTSALVMD